MWLVIIIGKPMKIKKTVQLKFVDGDNRNLDTLSHRIVIKCSKTKGRMHEKLSRKDAMLPTIS